MNFSIGCDLSYTVESAVSFVFDIEAVPNTGQSILSETLTLRPDLPVER